MDIDTLLAAAMFGCGLYVAAMLAHGIRVIRYARSPQPAAPPGRTAEPAPPLISNPA